MRGHPVVNVGFLTTKVVICLYSFAKISLLETVAEIWEYVNASQIYLVSVFNLCGSGGSLQ